MLKQRRQRRLGGCARESIGSNMHEGSMLPLEKREKEEREREVETQIKRHENVRDRERFGPYNFVV
ncbi:hypothetical protein L484_007053 [Morus notabilis]|uniref:Uncharacterized protein n=1 Tax=Morus notabilis TaxID=981085 RepID=W9RK96_9ROSA|nr:hypothetical protein L484_007053 [Morus notabilis]